jgi:Ni,Fe-hydrogenase maturation factor
VHQLTPELSELISKVELVVFVDACHLGQPGSCERFIREQIAVLTSDEKRSKATSFVVHQTHPVPLVSLCLLYGLD